MLFLMIILFVFHVQCIQSKYSDDSFEKWKVWYTHETHLGFRCVRRLTKENCDYALFEGRETTLAAKYNPNGMFCIKFWLYMLLNDIE